MYQSEVSTVFSSFSVEFTQTKRQFCHTENKNSAEGYVATAKIFSLATPIFLVLDI